MLKPIAFAHSLAGLFGGIYLAFYILAVACRDAFRFVFNAQFFGADVASLLPREFSFAGFLGTLVMIVILSWVFGFAWAWLYNRLAS